MRRTIIYLILFALVLGAAYYFNNRNSEDETTTAEMDTPAPVEYLFSAAEGLPNGITIQSKAGDIFEAARNEENAWVLTQPIEAAADQGSVEAAISQVATMRILQRLSNLAPEDVGLDQPDYTLLLKFTGGVERKVEIGVMTPTESGYYARGEDGKMLIISRNSLDSLLGLLTNPPIAVTETPPPTLP